MEKEIAPNDGGVADGGCHLHKFRLYETQANYYLIGRNKNRTCWRVLKINRLEPSELNICEDPTTYSQREYYDLLMRIHEGNRSTGGLKFVTNCYGIVGFVRFLGPYYMLLITKRRQIGTICGHTVYAVTKTEMITLPNPTVNPSMINPKSENRYKKLLCTVDLTKDFFFSYSYHIMRSLQKNLYDSQTGQIAYETMFVWNEFLTRGIRNLLKNTLWTVALVYGFFKQAKLSISGKDFKLTLIARRSRHYAGTRYLKRGVNEKGRVANDVETEQIVFPDVPGECLTEITSVVQNRGSIPLFWSQETSRLNIKPDIVLHKKDQKYEATRLHFENLVKRYGNPIIILNLIKKRERKPRESILRTEFANAIDFINKDLSEENRLRFLHWDLNKLSRSKATNVLALLGKVATYALTLTNFFYCQVTPAAVLASNSQWPVVEVENALGSLYKNDSEESAQNGDICINLSQANKLECRQNCFIKSPMLQNGVLRTNCIDCLDRTNVAQYAYGLAALGHQLHALGLIDAPKIDQDLLLANDLMRFYEKMGDTLALQYGGSAAHNKIFSERRGQWKAATQSQEIFRTLQRYYSNAYMDAEKQDAINVFLGHFQPQHGKPALWELGSDHHCDIGRLSNGFPGEIPRSSFKRSLSDGNILSESDTAIRSVLIGQSTLIGSTLSNRLLGDNNANGVPELNTEAGECSLSCSRQTPMNIHGQIFEDADRIYFSGHEEGSNCSNFLDLDWLSSSGNSCDEDIYERSSVISSPIESRSTENVMNSMASETEASSRENASDSSTGSFPNRRALPSNNSGYSDRFVHWVDHGETLCL